VRVDGILKSVELLLLAAAVFGAVTCLITVSAFFVGRPDSEINQAASFRTEWPVGIALRYIHRVPAGWTSHTPLSASDQELGPGAGALWTISYLLGRKGL